MKISDGDVRELRHALRRQLSAQGDYNSMADRYYMLSRDQAEQIVALLEEVRLRRANERAVEAFAASQLSLIKPLPCLADLLSADSVCTRVNLDDYDRDSDEDATKTT